MWAGAQALGMTKRLAAVAAPLLACVVLTAPAKTAEHGKSFPVRFGGPFELIDHTGTTQTNADFAGRFLLIYFGYIHCPDICPHNLQIMTEALERPGEQAERVQPIFITSDPARDTQELLAEYVENFHPALVGLTGSETQIRAVPKVYRVHRSKLVAKESTEADDYLVNHSSLTYLMGPEDEYVTLFPHDMQADFMAETVRKYLKGG
tara:strand:+ start:1927 stop:2547 length:621 start_codon:yes stop_codon:yes gene_type:complete